jgi:hypothetical protein
MYQHIVSVIDHSTIYTSLAFDHLAANDTQKKIIFIHAIPGLVYTGTTPKPRPSMKDGLGYWISATLLQKCPGLMIPWADMALDEAGER